jgi:glycosyltransferase involved in cell wall biosynthesis
MFKLSKKKNLSPKKILILFNLSMDMNDPILKFIQDWVGEFLKHYDEVFVFATHVGIYRQHPNLKVKELGGGSAMLRLRAIFRLIMISPFIYFKRSEIVVFHHMSTITTIFPGILIKMFGIRQGLWYSHSKADKFIEKGAHFMDAIFSPHKESFPIKDKSLPVHFSGHGINSPYVKIYNNKRVYDSEIVILSVGRVARVKKLEMLIETCGKMTTKVRNRIRIIIVGPVNDEHYILELKLLADQNSVRTDFLGSMKTKTLVESYSSSHFYYMGTPSSVDKAALEASFFGCIPLSNNHALQDLSGSGNLFRKYQIDKQNLESQLQTLMKLDKRSLEDIAETVAETARKYNNLNDLIAYIVRVLSKDVY